MVYFSHVVIIFKWAHVCLDQYLNGAFYLRFICVWRAIIARCPTKNVHEKFTKKKSRENAIQLKIKMRQRAMAHYENQHRKCIGHSYKQQTSLLHENCLGMGSAKAKQK